MGLDNGFYVKGVTRADLPDKIKYSSTSDFVKDEVEVAYFRKYWGFRNTYLSLLNRRFDDEVYTYKLDFEDLKLAIDLLKHYIDNDPSEADGGYWDENTKKQLKRNRKNLKKVYKWWQEHPDKEVYFYDSY